MQTHDGLAAASAGSASALVRWSGAAAVLGGIVWIAATVVHGSKPRGCVADECFRMSMRQSGPVDAALTLTALAFITIGAVGLLSLVRRTDRGRPLARIGAALAGGGTAVVVAAAAVQAAFFAGDMPHMPTFVIPGILALVVGVLVIGVAVLRSGVLPRPVGLMLVAGAVAMLGFNEQTAAVFLAVPMALAWMATGYVLWSGRVVTPTPPEVTAARG